MVFTSDNTVVYDHAGALERMGNDLQLFREMVGYLEQAGKQWRHDLRAAIAVGDAHRVHLQAHSLKGLISNFGTGRAWRAAGQVEELARARQLADLPGSLVELEAAFEELLGALLPFVERSKPA